MSGMSIRYSEAFKLQVIGELHRGELSNIHQAMEKYGINGYHTIQGWLRSYKRDDLLSKRVRIEMPTEQSEIKKLKKRIRELEKALAETTVDDVLHRAHFEILCEQMGLDKEETKKKIEKQLSKEDKS
jgi:transposase-like protein